MSSRSYSVHLVTANPGLRTALPALLARRAGIAFAGASSTPDEALAQMGHAPPDVVLAGSPPEDARQVMSWRAIRDCGPCIVMLTRYRDEGIDLRSLLAGASGLILVPERDVAEAVLHVAAGEDTHFDEARRYLCAIATGETPGRLTTEERRVLHLISAGLPDAAIASELATTSAGVRDQIARLVEKMS